MKIQKKYKKVLADTQKNIVMNGFRKGKVPKKVLESAIANAVNNNKLEADNLYIKEIYANPGQILKRMRPRAKGSGDRILKRTCHVTVVLAEKE